MRSRPSRCAPARGRCSPPRAREAAYRERERPARAGFQRAGLVWPGHGPDPEQIADGGTVATRLRDVAALAGVSVKTASNVLNNHPHVRASTRQRVEAAMAELHYRPNLSARSLKHGRAGFLALAVRGDRPTRRQPAHGAARRAADP